jgi:hypothetical protein
MPLICPTRGCKQELGLCIHEKIAASLVFIVIMAGSLFYLK